MYRQKTYQLTSNQKSSVVISRKSNLNHFQVTEGKVSIKDYHGLKREVQAGHTLVYKSYDDNIIQQSEIVSQVNSFPKRSTQVLSPPKSLRPKSYEEILYYTQTINTYFEWLKDYKDPIQLEVLNKNNELIFSDLVQGNTYLFNHSLSGDYTWKARYYSLKSESSFSKPRNISFKKVDPSNLTPQIIEIKRPGQEVKFNWEASSHKEARFLLSSAPYFDSYLINKKTSDSHYKAKNLSLGTYYWKVVDKNNKALTPIKVEIKASPAPVKPSKLPDLKIKLKSKNIQSSIFSSFLAYATDYEPVKLQLPKIEEAKKYEVVIFLKNRPNKPVATITQISPSINWKVLASGEYLWKYRYQDYWNRWSPFSESSQLTILPETFQKKMKPNKPKKKVTKKRIKKPVIQRKSSLLFGYKPSTLNYKQTDSSNNLTYKINGIITSGHHIQYKNSENYEVSYTSTAGAVYENEKLNIRSIQLVLPYSNAKFSPAVNLFEVSYYETKNNAISKSGNHISWGVGGILKLPFEVGSSSKFGQFESSLEIFLSNKDLHSRLSLSYEKHLNKSLSLVINSQLQHLNILLKDDTVETQSFLILTGLRKIFE